MYEGPLKLSYRSEASIECCDNTGVAFDKVRESKTVDTVSISNTCRINVYRGSL